MIFLKFSGFVMFFFKHQTPIDNTQTTNQYSGPKPILYEIVTHRHKLITNLIRANCGVKYDKYE